MVQMLSVAKMKSETTTTSRVKFTVNGEEYSVGSEVSANLMLVDFLRNYLELRGTKFMCREAGCGACLVAAVTSSGGPVLSINSCVVPVMSCNGWEITTVEKVGNKKDGYHAVQKALASTNGTQCGYCTPGWVMAMYSLVESGKDMTMHEIEESFGSNICRCTGYRPILDAFKKFATDSPSSIMDIENLHICNKSGNECCKKNCFDNDWCLVANDEEKNQVMEFTLKDGRKWYIVYTVQDIINVLLKEGTDSYMLAAGNTSKVPYPLVETPNIVIDICRVSELKGYQLDQNLSIGAGSTLTEVMEILDTASATDGFSYLKTINAHLDVVGHIPVRNLGTLGGNLMIKHQNNEFASDVFLLLETVGAEITIKSMLLGEEVLTMEEFVKTDMTGKVIMNVLLPPLSSACKIYTDKIMSRYQAVHAIVNAGFLYELDSDNKVTKARIVYGSLTTEVKRAEKTEEYLVGKALFTNETLLAALKVLEGELEVEEHPPEPSAAFRKQLALRLFYKGLLSMCPTETLHPKFVSGASKLRSSRGVSQASHTYTTDTSLYPLNEPMAKLEALIQCSGEALYSGDIPKQPREVSMSFVLASIPCGDIVTIDPTTALEYPGVIAFYSANDIPGLNSYTPNDTPLYSANEEVLCSGSVMYYGQPIGIIVAEDQLTADIAAKLVTATYKNVKTPVLDIKEAKSDDSRVTLYMTVDATDKGTDIEKVITDSNTVHGQYHFVMETVVCLTKPTEEGLEIHTATQWMNGVQLMVARALNIDESKIDVHCRRVGGSYGMKITRSGMAAVACSLVTKLLNRPCRIMQSLTTNTKALGKRLPFMSSYEVGVNSSGVIQYNKMNLYEDNGYTINEDFYGLSYDAINNCYDSSKWTYNCYNVITNTAKNTWCRAPGTLEFIANAELIMERIAYELSLDPMEVRLANLNTEEHAAVSEVYETLKASSDYENRLKEVEEFNTANRWKKKAIRGCFLRWTPVSAGLMNVAMSIYHGDGTVTLTLGGIEMGQGINTKAIQLCAYLLKIPISKIQVKASNSNTSPNVFVSGGSVTSENVGVCIQKCCETILGRLETIKSSMTDPTWEELIATAFTSNVDLHTEGSFSATDFQTYNVYGASIAECTIDVLTGESQINRVDMIVDMGRSINPEIDIGQTEGAFVMGLGYWLSEHLVYDSATGELLTNRTWNYHVPQAKDIPEIMNITLRNNSYSNDNAFGSKCVGEPPICMSVVIPLTLRQAIANARAETGLSKSEWFSIDGPFNVEAIGTAVSTEMEQWKFY